MFEAILEHKEQKETHESQRWVSELIREVIERLGDQITDIVHSLDRSAYRRIHTYFLLIAIVCKRRQQLTLGLTHIVLVAILTTFNLLMLYGCFNQKLAFKVIDQHIQKTVEPLGGNYETDTGQPHLDVIPENARCSLDSIQISF